MKSTLQVEILLPGFMWRLSNILAASPIFLVKAHLKPVLGYSSKIGYCEVDFHNVYIKLCWISAEV